MDSSDDGQQPAGPPSATQAAVCGVGGGGGNRRRRPASIQRELVQLPTLHPFVATTVGCPELAEIPSQLLDPARGVELCDPPPSPNVTTAPGRSSCCCLALFGHRLLIVFRRPMVRGDVALVRARARAPVVAGASQHRPSKACCALAQLVLLHVHDQHANGAAAGSRHPQFHAPHRCAVGSPVGPRPRRHRRGQQACMRDQPTAGSSCAAAQLCCDCAACVCASLPAALHASRSAAADLGCSGAAAAAFPPAQVCPSTSRCTGVSPAPSAGSRPPRSLHLRFSGDRGGRRGAVVPPHPSPSLSRPPPTPWPSTTRKLPPHHRRAPARPWRVVVSRRTRSLRCAPSELRCHLAPPSAAAAGLHCRCEPPPCAGSPTRTPAPPCSNSPSTPRRNAGCSSVAVLCARAHGFSSRLPPSLPPPATPTPSGTIAPTHP